MKNYFLNDGVYIHIYDNCFIVKTLLYSFRYYYIYVES